MNKPFLNYDEQINKLKSKNLIIDDEDYAKTVLQQYGYYSLICGYKHLFKNPTTKNYIDKTRFEEIVQLYEFDTKLREVFLKYLLLTEKRIKEVLSNSFCENYSENQSAYTDPHNYNYAEKKNRHDINRLINDKFKELLKSNKYPYIKHAREVHGNVPLWVVFKALSFGSVSVMYRVLKPGIKSSISHEYPNLNEGNLGELLQIASTCRNVCAHGERLFTFWNKHAIPILAIHDKLKIARTKSGNECICGQKDLFAVVISLRYLLNDKDFKEFKTSLSRIIDKYELQISNSNSHISKEQVLGKMGFPSNWKSITRFRKLV